MNGFIRMAYNIPFIALHLCQPLIIIVKEIVCPHELLNFMVVMSSLILVWRILSKALYIFISLSTTYRVNGQSI